MGNYDRGEYLKKLLKKNGLTQTELSNKTGISRQSIGAHISDNSYFKIDNYLRIATVLDVTVDDLIFGGRKRTTRLKRFAQKSIQEIDIEKMPNQPDPAGKYLIDYIVELNDVDKFYYFLEKDLYKIPIHNHLGTLGMLIKNNQFDFLKKQFKCSIFDDRTNIKLRHNHMFLFPNLRYTHYSNGKVSSRNNYQYSELDLELKNFIDILLGTESKEILDLLPYVGSDTLNKAPFLFYWAVENNKVFVVDYYMTKLKLAAEQWIYDNSIKYKAWKVAKYFFENYRKLRTNTNLSKIADKKYIKVKREELGFN